MNNQQYFQNQTPYKAGVGAVNIQIYNPSVSPEGASAPNGYIPNGQNYGNYLPPAYVPPYVNNAGNNYYAQQSNNYENQNKAPLASNALNRPQENQVKKAIAESKPVAKTTVKKPVEESAPPPLTNEYIQTLENYLNSQNKELRFDAANQVVGEFRVHKSRNKDPQLTPLLNKILQDPYQGVRLLGLSVIESGHAKGDDNTIMILKNMQNSKKVYNQDALLASKILLKMAGNKLQPKDPKSSAPAPAVSAVPQGQKLNVVSS